jgi:putative ABC transport system ATP-binding protein
MALSLGAPPAVQALSLYRFFRSGPEEVQALRGVSLSVTQGEFVAITGPSGSGKSTLLACLAGTDDPDGGSVHIAGHALSQQPEPTRCAIRARHIGMLFQNANLFDHLTVAQNVTLVTKLVPRTARADALDLLCRLGLDGKGAAYPRQLSGGELARAALAVAAANAPTVLLADEPTGELDSRTESVVLQLLQQAAERGAAVIVASHSPAVAGAAARVVHIEDGCLCP